MLVSGIPPSVTMCHTETKLIDLNSYFRDDDGDALTMTAKYSYNGGPNIIIPLGIFTKPTPMSIAVAPTSAENAGTYVFTLEIKDLEPKILESSLTVTITNNGPYLY